MIIFATRSRVDERRRVYSFGFRGRGRRAGGGGGGGGMRVCERAGAGADIGGVVGSIGGAAGGGVAEVSACGGASIGKDVDVGVGVGATGTEEGPLGFVLESSSSSSEEDSESEEESPGFRGGGGRGAMIALSRPGGCRRGREGRCRVVARRRCEQKVQW